MSLIFPTAKNVTVALDGYRLDLIFRMDWKEEAPRIPRYGYNDYEYSMTIPGRKIVQGFIVMNFITPNYLGVILENKARKTADSAQTKTNELVQALPPNDIGSRKARAQTLADILFPPNQDLIDLRESQQAGFSSQGHRLQGPNPVVPASTVAVKEQMIKQFVEAERTINIPSMNSPLDFHNGRFTMDVYYHDVADVPWFTRFYNVEFTNVSQSYSAAGADGSAEPIYETYEFISSRRHGVMADRPTSSKDVIEI